MIRVYLLVVVIAIGLMAWRKLPASKNSWRALYSKTTVFALCGLIVLLGMTGHLAWLTAMIGVVVAFMLRTFPLILRYGPQLHRFWQSLKGSKQQERASGSFEAPRQGKMAVAEAYKILGLTPPVAKQDIVLAHKKLMQKMHPDRGGSDYLASQINLAKDLLLKD